MKTAIGVDIGGTKISMVVGTEKGRVLAHRVIPTLTGSRTREGIRELFENLEVLIRDSGVKKSRILGLGIGVPGPVNSEKGIVPKSPYMTGWTGIPLRKMLEARLKIPVTLTNDANAAALGEKRFGGGKSELHFCYLTISTGIGAGIISNGELVEGASFMGGEVGHMKIVAGGRKCKCGKLGCLEPYASGTAIGRVAEEAMRKGTETKISEFLEPGGHVSAREVGLAAQKGDPLALHIFKEAGFYLGIGISNLLHLVNPGMVVLGGGVLRSSPKIFWSSMLRSCKQASWPPAFNAVRICRSRLKDRVGDLGALALVFERLSTRR